MSDKLYIGLYRGKSWLSKSIRWFTWSSYSHASLVWMSDEEVLAIFEAWGKGVTETQFFFQNHTPGTRIDLYEFRQELTHPELDAIIEAARKEKGKPYDWRGVLSFLYRRRMQKAGAWFCSELAAHCCLAAKRGILNLPPWKISPGAIATSPELRLAWKVTA